MYRERCLHSALKVVKTISTAIAASLVFPLAALAESGSGCNFFPASASIGTRVDQTYFEPTPTNSRLVGSVQTLRSGTVSFDRNSFLGTVTLPLYKGYLKSGEAVWYIITDTDDEANAEALGFNFSSKLSLPYRT